MKQLKLSFLLTVLLSMAGAKASAHDIEVANADGVTIYYNWINNNTELAVSCRGKYYDSYSNEYSGNIVIPESVIYNGNTYSVTRIGQDAFYECSNLTSVTIPISVTSIGNLAFGDCTGLTSIAVEPGNTTYNSCENSNAIIETSTNTLIAGCKNTVIPNSVTSIGKAAFFGCTGLTSITIPNSVTSIGDYAFDGCTGLTNLTIPNSVTSIGCYVFYWCTGLTSVTISNSVTSIGDWAFYECTGLTTIISEIQQPFEIRRDVFVYWNNDTSSYQFIPATLYVPKGTKEKYESTSAWNLFEDNIIELEDPTEIKSARNEEIEKIEYFDLNGSRLDAPKKGLNIIRMSDGTSKKIVVK